MTGCAECLTELTAVRLAEIRADSPIALHYAGCYDCRRAAEEMFYAESSLARALAEATPLSSAARVTERALAGSELLKRRKVARLLRVFLFAVAAALLAAAAEAFLEDDNYRPESTVTRDVITVGPGPTVTREVIKPEDGK